MTIKDFEKSLEVIFHDYKIIYAKNSLKIKCNITKRYLVEIHKEYNYLRVNKFIVEPLWNIIPWNVENDKLILEILKKHIKFKGGTLIIPQLEELGLITKLKGTGIPSWFK
jgi:hypothetical protein